MNAGLLARAADSVGLWVVQATWQASLLIVLVFVLRLVFRERLTPRWRYALWLLVVARLTMPVAPPSPTSLFNLVLLAPPGGPPGVAVGGPVRRAAVAGGPDGPAGRVPNAASGPSGWAAQGSSWGGALFAGWAAVAALLLARVAGRSYALTSRVCRQRPVTRQAVLDLLEDGKQELGVRVPIAVVQSPEVTSPALLGFLRPRLLLPERLLETLDHHDLRLLFLHELAHAKRRDVLVNWLATAAHVLHWFNPLVALAMARMRADRELATDALVLSRGQDGDAHRYGHALVRLVEFGSSPGLLPGSVGVLEDKAELKRRVTMIARHGRDAYRGSALAAALMVLLASTTLTAAWTGGPAEAAPGHTAAVAASATLDTAPARAAVEEWLALVDARDYARSWEEASPAFRSAVTRDAWMKMAAQAREPLGALLSRQVLSVKHQSSLPGAPDGDYVVVLTEASFERMEKAVETATVKRGDDGRWRAVGYYVRPGARARDTAAAEQALGAWLALVDGGEYGRSWDAAASRFRSALGRPEWESAIRQVRGPLGRVLSRDFHPAALVDELPGVPRGTYVVVTTSASFENKQGAMETCTMQLEEDGRWRLAGYFIK